MQKRGTEERVGKKDAGGKREERMCGVHIPIYIKPVGQILAKPWTSW